MLDNVYVEFHKQELVIDILGRGFGLTTPVLVVVVLYGGYNSHIRSFDVYSAQLVGLETLNLVVRTVRRVYHEWSRSSSHQFRWCPRDVRLWVFQRNVQAHGEFS